MQRHGGAAVGRGDALAQAIRKQSGDRFYRFGCARMRTSPAANRTRREWIVPCAGVAPSTVASGIRSTAIVCVLAVLENRVAKTAPGRFSVASISTDTSIPASALALRTTTVSLSLRIRENASTPGVKVDGPKFLPSPDTGRKYCRP